MNKHLKLFTKMNEDNQYHIKKLSSQDIKMMRLMLDLFGEVFQEKDTYCQNQPNDSYLESLLNQDYFIAIVAIASNRIVWGLTAYELQKFEQKRSEIYIYDLAVYESFRRRGIATSLINEVKNEAKKRGAYVIFVQADYGDEPAIQLYSKLGIKEEVLHFDIPPTNH